MAVALRRFLAVAVARAAALVSRCLGRGGNALPGLVAEAIAPNLLYQLVEQIPQGHILVSGTNGKTTTTALIGAAISGDGWHPLTNVTGSNLSRGILSLLLSKVGPTGRPRWPSSAVGVFEIDEAQLIASLPRLRPRAVVLTNLFRDQLDRYGELDSLVRGIAAALGECKNFPVLVINADDPGLAQIGNSHRGTVVTFGLEHTASERQPDEWADSILCPECGQVLDYSGLAFSHLGRWRCSACALSRPSLDVVGRITAADLQGLKMELAEPIGPMSIESPLPGAFNAYNLLAALAASSALGIEPSRAADQMSAVPPSFGRAERVMLGSVEITLMLMKNPAGANELARLVAGENADLLVLLNDRVADGEDVSWIWDVNFSQMGPRSLVTGGSRAADMALRLKYAGLAVDYSVDGPVEPALDAALGRCRGRLLVLSTYTAMLEFRKVLVGRGAAEQYWADK